MLTGISRRLQPVFGSSRPVLPFTTSGTGGLEVAAGNVIAPGDEVVAVTIGYFGDRFADVAAGFGAAVSRLQVPWGEAAAPDALRRLLRRRRAVKAVLLTHNETATGAVNPLPELAAVVHQESAALLLVDVVSSVGGMPVEVDRHGIDIAVGVTQKALMSPPGLALVAVSDRALRVAAANPGSRWSLDLVRMAESVDAGTTSYTPAVTVLFALDAALAEIESEGLAAVFERHRTLAGRLRAGLANLGVVVRAEPGCRSDTVTAVRIPGPGATAAAVRRRLADHGIAVSAGREDWHADTIRIGHLGWVSEPDIDDLLAALTEIGKDWT